MWVRDKLHILPSVIPIQVIHIYRASVRENLFPNRDCQRGALLCETVPCDAVTSGFVSDLFTVRLDDKGQTMLVICLQFNLSKKAKQSILTRSNFFQIVYKCYISKKLFYKLLVLKYVNIVICPYIYLKKMFYHSPDSYHQGVDDCHYMYWNKKR